MKIQKNIEETRKAIVDLKIQLEEAKMIEEVLKNHLDEEEKSCQKLEMEVVDLRKMNEISSAYVKFNNSSVIVDEILYCQRSPFEKYGLG